MTDTVSIIGAIFVICSVIIIGAVIPRLRNKMEKTEEKISELSKVIAANKDSYKESRLMSYHADTLSSILTVTKSPPDSAIKSILTKISHLKAGSILTICQAAIGEVPSKEQHEKWNTMQQEAAIAALSDPEAYTALDKEYNDLMDKWQDRNNNVIVPEQTELKTALRKHKEKESKWLRLSTALQVFGIIAVLMKDVFSNGGTP